MKNLSQNREHQDLWGKDSVPDMTQVFRSCLGYAACPGWSRMQETVFANFDGFQGLETVELGCGEGKGSLLFALRGAKTTLIDYSEKQLRNARYVAEQFRTESVFRQGNILELPTEVHGRFDVSMSFGTAEHFFEDDRQSVFDVHAKALKPRGVTFIWVPNRWGFLFHAGAKLRRSLGRETCHVDEIPFSRKELFERASRAGLQEVRIVGAEHLRNDFNQFILDVPKLLRLSSRGEYFESAENARRKLLATMTKNKRPTPFLANYFSYPLLLIGRA